MPAIVNAIVQNAGQTCSAGSRLLVERSVYEPLLERLAEAFRRLRVGPALADLDCGPLIRATQLQRVRDFLSQAEHDGIAMAAQGQVVDDAPQTGFYQAPTLLRDVPPEHRLAQEDVRSGAGGDAIRDEADAVRIANGTRFGLVAGVWTRDGARQLRMARRCAAGRCSSTTMAPAAASSCRSAASSRPATAARRVSRRCYGFTALKTVVLQHG